MLIKEIPQYFVISLHVQASEAELIFNRYRRDGHQFSVSVYNKLLQCWVKKASKVYLYVNR